MRRFAIVVCLVMAACGGSAATPSSSPTPTLTPTPIPGAASPAGPPPAPGRIAFTSAELASDTWIQNSEIYVMDPDGSDVVRLTHSPAAEGAPAWSPDGSRIAFESATMTLRDAEAVFWGKPQIYVMDADGSDIVRLTDMAGHKNYAPAWSPDGTRIAFASELARRVSLDIYVMDPDGSNVVRLTNDPKKRPNPIDVSDRGSNGEPAWSPDGTRIAFTLDTDMRSDREIRMGSLTCGGEEGCQKSKIWVMDPDGSDVVRLTDSPMAELHPAWSPDGTRIAFSSNAEFRNSEKSNDEIYVMDADGSNVVRLTMHPASDGDPAWSPDGTRIAFTSDRDGNSEIYVMDADGSNVVRLTRSEAQDFRPAWSPVFR